MAGLKLPLIIRGEIIEGETEDFGSFSAPSLAPYLDRIVLADPGTMRDVHQLSIDEIISYLEELASNLELGRNEHMQEALERSVHSAGLSSREMLEGHYRRFPSMCRREALVELVEQNLGDLSYLNGWQETQLHDRRMAIRAFGARTVHVIAGSSPSIGLLTVVNNALSRGDAIIKIPSNEPYSAVAIARTMIEMAPDHPLTRHVSVAYWRGGDDTVQRRLYDHRNIEKIVAWGGNASMQSIRQYLSPGIDLIALDPKLSASIIGAGGLHSEDDVATAAARAAEDVGYWNQGGCASARVIYVETGTDADGLRRANDFGERLFNAIQALPPDLSSPHPAFDPVLRDEINGIRLGSGYRVFGGRGNEGAVIVSQEPERVDFADQLTCRVANVVPVDSVVEALDYLNIYTQTIGVYPHALKAEIRDECALRGGQRIVSLGHALSMGTAGPNDALNLLGRMVRWVRDDTLENLAGILHDAQLAVSN